MKWTNLIQFSTYCSGKRSDMTSILDEHYPLCQVTRKDTISLEKVPKSSVLVALWYVICF